MKSYTVQQIADILGTKPETVRRWIRDGKLKATQKSKKAGNIIEESDFQKFLEAAPKYAGIVAGITGFIPAAGIPLAVIGGAAGGAALAMNEKKKLSSMEVSEDEWGAFLRNNIKTSKMIIAQKQLEIQLATQAINVEEEKIREYEELLKQIEEDNNSIREEADDE